MGEPIKSFGQFSENSTKVSFIRKFIQSLLDCVLCVALFVLRLLISFMISSRSTWEKLKEKPELQIFFIAIRLG